MLVFRNPKTGHPQHCKCKDCPGHFIVSRGLPLCDPGCKLVNMKTIPWAGEDEAEKEKKN
jgi:hypothetical protein